MKLGQAAKKVDIEVKGLKLLLLTAETREDVSFAHADWADAKLLVTGARPAIVGAPHEDPYVLTPKPPRTPRINGARIFGVHPGHPFLFTIAATGDRPMTFAADHLPKGLSVDAQTGQIQGRIEKPGTYVVTLRAANSLGKAKSKFRIVCGETLALTPHMGWNSWYVWEGHVTDKIMRDAADAMVSSGMINHGYQYVNIDDCWAVKQGATDPTLGGEPRDARGMVNANQRFPDMKALTDYIHAKGLKAGIYTSPGPTTCAGHVGAWQHEELDARRFAEWGYDFLKYDWCSYGRIATNHSLPELEKPYRLMGDILRRQDRDFILNLCQYGMGKVWEWGKEVGGHSWRTAGDLGGSFYGIPGALFRDGFDVYAQNELHKFGGPGGWNDPDYLLLGYLSNWQGGQSLTPLTPNGHWNYTIVVTREFVQLLTPDGQAVWRIPYVPAYPTYNGVTVSFLEATNRFALWLNANQQTNKIMGWSLPFHVVWLAAGRGALESTNLPSLSGYGGWKVNLTERLSRSVVPPAFYSFLVFLSGMDVLRDFPWNDLLFSVATAVVCAAAGWCLGRRYHFAVGGQLKWALFHLLFGLPGLLGFLCVQEWPTREACPNCKKPRLVDREKCGTAERDLRHHRKTETEIFESIGAN